MPADQLTNRERATLIVLLAEGRELTNAQMKEVAGFTLDGEPRRRLVEQKLITADKHGRAFSFEITDRGAAWCAQELSAELPARASYLGGALYAVLAALARNGAHLAELLPPRSASTAPAVVDVDAAIRAAYSRADHTDNGWAGLGGVREQLDGLTRAQVDAALVEMASSPGIHLQPEPHQARLTDDDRAAAVVVGGTARHMMKIEAG